ncbi:MAG: hypothetical protein HOW73_47620 [Polyangiaceae bacterium]|nr:hypothetical protein [Polyangiaceae bacterium]
MADDPNNSGDDKTKNEGDADKDKQDDIGGKVRTIVSGMLKTAVPKAVNDAVAAALKTSLETELAPLKDFLAKSKEPAKTDADGDKDKDKGKQKQEPPAPDPEVAALKKKFDKLEADHKLATEKLAKERAKSLETSAYGKVKDALNGKVRPEAMRLIENDIRARGLLAYDDEGNATMKVRVSLGKNQGEEEQEHSIEDAIPHLLKEKEYALFLPAPSDGAGGTKRAGPANRGNNGQFTPDPKDPFAALEAQHGPINDLI